ncbi:MAG: DNA primase [bacterium]|nr:DNA primase [bacterium]
MHDIVNQIKKAIDYRDFFSRFLKLKKVGSTHMSLCPFHPDSQPSLSIDLERGLWYCFGCNKGGDIFNFIMEMEGCNFLESVKCIADMLSIEFKTEQIQNFVRKSTSLNYELYGLLAKFYHNVLLKSSISTKAREYLQRRGIDNEIIEQYQLGYCPKNIENLKIFCKKKGINIHDLYESGILYKKGNDFQEILAGRIVIPIYNPNGLVIGFSGRDIDDKDPKYINTIGFVKTNTLYGINLAKSYIRANDSVFLVEGYFDVWSMYLSGHRNSVGLMGTSISDKQIDIIKRYCNNAILFLDFDKSGQESTLNAIINLASHGLSVKIVSIKDYKDPHEVFSSDPDLLRNINRFSVDDIKYMTDRYFVQPNAYERQKFLEKFVIPFLRSIRKKIIREEYVKKFCLDTSISYRYLSGMITGHRDDYQISEEEEAIKKYGLETYILIFALINFEIFEKFYPKLEEKLFSGKEIYHKLFKYLIECVNNKVQPNEYIVHELSLSEVLKSAVKVSIKMDKDQKEIYFTRLINSLYKKRLVLELKDSIKKEDYEKVREIQEKLRKLG